MLKPFHTWQVSDGREEGEKPEVIDGRNERALELDRIIELEFGHSIVKPPRPLPQSVADRQNGAVLRRQFGLVQCPSVGCDYFLIVMRGQRTSRCPRCSKQIWLCDVRALATSDYVQKLHNLIPRLHGRPNRELLPHEAGDLDRFSMPRHIKLTRLAEGKSVMSSCGESHGAPHNDEPGVMPRAHAAKKELVGSAQREAGQDAHVSPRQDRGMTPGSSLWGSRALSPQLLAARFPSASLVSLM